MEGVVKMMQVIVLANMINTKANLARTSIFFEVLHKTMNF
jgi:hypothetical protein